MTSLIQTLNDWGQIFCHHALWMLVQSGVLVAILWGLDTLLRRRVKASIRYAIWLLVLVKLVLPVDFKLPSGIGYWLHWHTQQPSVSQPAPLPKLPAPGIAVNTNPSTTPTMQTAGVITTPTNTTPMSYQPAAPIVKLSMQGWILAVWLGGIVILACGFIWQMITVKGIISRSKSAPEFLMDLLKQSQLRLQMAGHTELKQSDEISGPAVCGLLRPVILIPTNLLSRLDQGQFEAVILHELSHIQRGDLWLNTVQTLFQIFYFYNPFVRLANHYIRKTREQANDERVLVYMNGRRDTYSAALVEVAAAVIGRPMFAVRLIGVAEPKNHLHERITLMMRKSIPTNTKIGFAGFFVLVLLAAVLLPMAAGSRALAQAVPTVSSLTKEQIIEIQQQTTERMYTAYNQGNAAALAGEFTDDGISLQNLAEPSMGKVSIQSLYTELMKSGMKFLSVKPYFQEIWTSGKYVFIAAQNGVTYQRPDMRQYLTDFINTFSVYEIQPDGSVKIKLDSYGLSSMPTDNGFFKENGKCEVLFNPQEENPAAADTKDIETVKNLDLEFHKACDDKKPGSVLASYYTDDTVMMTIKQNMIRGNNNLLPLLKIVQTNTPLVSMEQEILSAEGNSQMIFIVNKFTWKVKSSDKPGEVTSIPGKGVHVWKKQADGSWKILIDMVNTDIEI